VESDFAFFALTAEPCEECMRARLAKMGIWSEDVRRLVLVSNDRASLSKHGTEVKSLVLETVQEIRTNILHDMFVEGQTCDCSCLSKTISERDIDSPSIHDTRTPSRGKIQTAMCRISSLIIATRKTNDDDHPSESPIEVLTSKTENPGCGDVSACQGTMTVPGSFLPGASTLARALEVDEPPIGLEDVEPPCSKADGLPSSKSSDAEGLDVLRGSLIVVATNPMYTSMDYLQDKPPSPIKKRKSTITLRPNWREMLRAFQMIGAAKIRRNITTPKDGRRTWVEVDTFFAETADLRVSNIEEAKPCLRRRLTSFTGGAFSNVGSSIWNVGFRSVQRIRSGSRCGSKENIGSEVSDGMACGEAFPAAIRGSTRILHPLFEPGSNFHMRSGRQFGAEVDRGSIPFGRI